MTEEQGNFLENLYRENFQHIVLAVYPLLKDLSQAQVAVQEAARIACQKPEEVMNSPNPVGWLRKTAELVAKNMLRTRARQMRIFSPLEELRPGAEPFIRDESTQELLEICRAAVSEEDFSLFHKVVLEGHPHIEAAKEAGLTLWACYKRVERTQKRLQKALEDFFKSS